MERRWWIWGKWEGMCRKGKSVGWGWKGANRLGERGRVQAKGCDCNLAHALKRTGSDKSIYVRV